MKTVVYADGKKISLNPFMENLTGNIMLAIVRSLKAPDGNKMIFLLRNEELSLEIDGALVPLNQGSAQRIAGNVLRGLVMSLHGVESGAKFDFVLERNYNSGFLRSRS